MTLKNEKVIETKTESASPKAKSLIIKIEDLVPFKDHPYKVIENESMIELTDSISEHGILNPCSSVRSKARTASTRSYPDTAASSPRRSSE